MNQMHPLELLKMDASDLFLQQKLMMIFHLLHTMYLPPNFAVDFWVPVHY
jgi:hypothetical protein